MTNNFFSQEYYGQILERALDSGYIFITVNDFFQGRYEDNKKFAILRHDVDFKPMRCSIFHEEEKRLNIKASYFILVHDINYNPFSVNVLKMLKAIEAYGSEIGLHTNYVETAHILNEEPSKVLAAEIQALRSHFDIKGVACHRNIDFMHNSLPHLEMNWLDYKNKFDVSYQAYDLKLMESVVFVNEGINPHLCWRSITPEMAIDNGDNFCLSTHPHWWHKEYAFED